ARSTTGAVPRSGNCGCAAAVLPASKASSNHSEAIRRDIVGAGTPQLATAAASLPAGALSLEAAGAAAPFDRMFSVGATSAPSVAASYGVGGFAPWMILAPMMSGKVRVVVLYWRTASL